MEIGDQRLEETYHPNGKPKTVAIKKRTEAGWVTDGVVRTFYASGKKRGILQFKMGLKHGYWESFYEDGTQYSESHYSNGQPINTWKRYYTNGQLMDESRFEKISASTWYVHMKVYTQSGSLRESGRWKRQLKAGQKEVSQKDGEWRYFDAQGTIERTEQYVDGVER